jgi:hypothetical protein
MIITCIITALLFTSIFYLYCCAYAYLVVKSWQEHVSHSAIAETWLVPVTLTLHFLCAVSTTHCPYKSSRSC